MEKPSLRNLEANNAKLLEAQAHIWQHQFSFINSMCLKCAIEMDIPDIIQNHNKPITLSQLIHKLPNIHNNKTQFMYRIMRVLVTSGFVALQQVCETDNDGPSEPGYVLTDASKLLLCRDNPLTLTPCFFLAVDYFSNKPWHSLSAWLQNDDLTPFKTTYGTEVWEHGKHDRRWASLFNDAMASDSRLVASLLVEKGKSALEGLASLVDVGGGTVTVAKAISMAFPSIECTVLDLPHVVADLQGSDNLKFVGGDMFHANTIPPTDAVLLKAILHGWSDEKCVELLKRCKEAVTCKENKRGKVLIIEIVMENEKLEDGIDEKSCETAKLYLDMVMMVFSAGKERNEKEWAKLFSDAGFNNYKVTPILGLRSLIEVYP